MDIENFNILRLQLANAFSTLTRKLNSRMVSFPSYHDTDGKLVHPKNIEMEAKEIIDEMEYIRWAILLLAGMEDNPRGLKSVLDDIKKDGGIVKFNAKQTFKME